MTLLLASRQSQAGGFSRNGHANHSGNSGLGGHGGGGGGGHGGGGGGGGGLSLGGGGSRGGGGGFCCAAAAVFPADPGGLCRGDWGRSDASAPPFARTVARAPPQLTKG